MASPEPEEVPQADLAAMLALAEQYVAARAAVTLAQEEADRLAARLVVLLPSRGLHGVKAAGVMVRVQERRSYSGLTPEILRERWGFIPAAPFIKEAVDYPAVAHTTTPEEQAALGLRVTVTPFVAVRAATAPEPEEGGLVP